MILIIPAEELHEGHCTRCIQGEPGMDALYHEYSDHPTQLTKLWRRENAKSLHVTDRDGFEGYDNSANVTTILEMVKSVDIPIILISRFSTIEECRFWLESGIYRIVLGKIARKEPEKVRELIEEFTPSRVVFGIVANNGIITHHNNLPEMTDIEFALFVRSLGGTRIVYTDIACEGTLAGPNWESLKRIAQESGLHITSAGGIANVQQLWALQKLESFGIDSVVIGRAFYENRFPCQKIWRIAEAESEPELAVL